AAAAGAATATGQAPLGLWWVALPALAVMFHAILRADGWKRAAVLAWSGGTAYFAVALCWIVEPFLIDAPRHGWMAPFALVLLAGGLALFWALAGGGAAALGGSRAARAMTLAVALATAEHLRGYALTGFAWAQVGHVLIDTPLVQLAAWTGPAGLTLVVTLAAVAPIAAGTARGSVLAVGAAAAAIAALWAAGSVR